MQSFEEADQVVHQVESEWHYPILTAAGFTAQDKTGVGFVRSYKYTHPNGTEVRVTTGSHADYWSAKQDGKEINGGYWGTLEPWTKSQWW